MFSFLQASRLPKRRNRPVRAGWKPLLELLEDRTLLSSFADGFEGPTLNPFWSTFTNAGSVTVPSGAQAHSGTHSAQFNSTYFSGNKEIYLYHQFAQPAFGHVSVWVYDTGANVSSSNYLFLTLDNSVVGMRSDIGTFDYDLGPGNGGDVYYYRGW